MGKEIKTAQEIIQQSQLNIQLPAINQDNVIRCSVCYKKEGMASSICKTVAEAANCKNNPINIRKNG